MDNRRKNMDALKDIPEEVLEQAENPADWDDIPEASLDCKSLLDEALDLYQEKQYLLKAVEYLKQRLSKVQTTK